MPQHKRLTAEHERMIEDALRDIYDAQQDVAKLENCGVDCQRHRQRLDKSAQKLELIKREFFS